MTHAKRWALSAMALVVAGAMAAPAQAQDKIKVGVMFSMTGASFLLPFLPMIPIQILFNNFLYDLSQVAIPSDEVDEEYLKRSRPWNIGYIKKFMMYFGPLSSLFDFMTFGVLIFVFHAKQDLFATGWFLGVIIGSVCE